MGAPAAGAIRPKAGAASAHGLARAGAAREMPLGFGACLARGVNWE